MDHAPVADRPTPPDAEPAAAATPTDEARCPVPHGSVAEVAPSAPATPLPAPGPEAATSGCPVPHAGPAVPAEAPDAARCPVPHGQAAAGAPGCPLDHRGRPVRRTKADQVVRTVLRIKERPAGVTQREVYAAFQKSMLISATRCTLTYVIFPFVLPAVGLALTGAVGVAVGLAAMVADVFTIRRFFAVDHRYRWYFSTIVFGIMCLLTALLVQDISHLAGHG